MQNRRLLHLFLLPLLVPLVVMALTLIQGNRVIHEESGNYSSIVVGERQSLLILSRSLEANSRNFVITVRYFVTPPESKVLWIYLLEYNRRSRTLDKQSASPYRSTLSTPTKIERWVNVKEEDIHQITAALRELKTVQQIAAYQGGNIKDLEQLGAKRQIVP